MAQEIGDLFDANSTRMKPGRKGMAEDMDLSRPNARARKRPPHRSTDVVNTHRAAAESAVTNEQRSRGTGQPSLAQIG